MIMYNLAESNTVYPDTGRYNCNIEVILRGFWSTKDLYYVSHIYLVILIKIWLFLFFKLTSVSPVNTCSLLELTVGIGYYVVLLQKMSDLLAKLLSCLF